MTPQTGDTFNWAKGLENSRMSESQSHGVVVVAEDNDEIRELLTLVLESDGYQVVQVADGAQVVPTVQRVRPQLLLLDLAMPNKHGNEVLQELAADGKTHDLPVFVVSAYTNQLKKTRQVKRIIPKPFEVGELLEQVEREIGPAGAAH